MHESPAADYDALPYEGHPDPVIHPDRMASVAWLHGVEAAPLETARILEIGCAAGAHLIPMAYQLPGASFVGFDCSSKQIAMALAAAAEVGVDNLRFEVRDICDDHQDLGAFDYVLAHGVFSWVPRDVQDALLRVCRKHLAPSGVALIDYNVYPGWHLRGFLRDLMRFHQHDQTDLAAAADAAVDSLDYVAAHLFAPSSPFGQSVGHLQRWARAQGRNYLAHEFGSAAGQPVSFADFSQSAREHGLRILGDAQITQVVPAQFAASLATKLREVAGGDYVRREQYLDFLRGRDFRRTLLVADHVQGSREILPQAVRRLRFSTVARREAAPRGAIFRCPDGAMLHTDSAPLIGALSALCRAGPGGMAFDALYRAAGPAPTEVAAGAGFAAFTASLLEAAAGSLIQVHAHCPRVVNALSAKPLANAVARAAARAGQEVATSMLQRDWRLDPFEVRLLGLLDGTHDRQALGKIMLEQVQRGEIALGPAFVGRNSAAAEWVEAHLTSSLEWMVRVGMMIG